ncbi:hypothetical protein [Microbacterium aquimaris]|uniref:DUF3558 domain-containing protein n=1 Tax=Microbacterium aquimaris TaxID=459816 RepID=A0ABU5N4T7_9MICO|nr:hypothetical protein [Microbacterium aquimaris]MDZ8161083.1 hypothetical protein [Microbacterium aquimaris]
MMRPRTRRTALAVVSVLTVAGLVACAPDPAETPVPTVSEKDVTGLPSPVESMTPDATPSPTAEAAAEIPTDCLALVDADVQAQLYGIPLNDPAFGPSGVQADGSLTCIWADPGSDTTSLVTTIERISRGPALDQLNTLVEDEGFTCYTPDGGTRCEKTWQNPDYPVTDGRTLFWRADLMIDTRYSNLAPDGYTASVIAAIWDD